MSNNTPHTLGAPPPIDPHPNPQNDAAKIVDDPNQTPPSHTLAPYAAVDCETSGLDPNTHEVLTVGIVLADKQLNEVAHFHIYVHPTRLQDAALESLVVAGFDEGLWQNNAHATQSAAQILAPWLMGRQLIAHNIEFDLTFLGKLFRAGKRNVPWSFRQHCTLKAMRAAVKAGAVRSKGSSLVAACEAFKIPLERREGQPHNALDDARAGLGVAQALVRRGLMRL